MLVRVTDHPGRFLRALRTYSGMNVHSAREAGLPSAADHPERVAWGATQPLVALRLLLSHRDLLRAALIPPFWLAAACLLIALTDVDKGVLACVKRFYLTFAA